MKFKVGDTVLVTHVTKLHLGDPALYFKRWVKHSGTGLGVVTSIEGVFMNVRPVIVCGPTEISFSFVAKELTLIKGKDE